MADPIQAAELVDCVHDARSAMWRVFYERRASAPLARYRRPARGPSEEPAVPDPPRPIVASDVQWEYAEYLWLRAERERDPRLATELWERAARQFTATAHTETMKSSVVRESAYAAVLAWKNALSVDPRTADPIERDDGSMEPLLIPQRERALVAAFHDYTELVDAIDSDEAVMMMFLEARVLWRFRHYDEAVALFERILSEHLEHEVAVWAANLLLDSLNRVGRYADLASWVERLLSEKAFLADEPDLRERLQILRGQILRKKAESYEKSNDYAGCARAYEELYRVAPTARYADELLYNAGVCHARDGAARSAIAAHELLIATFPKSSLARRARVRTANAYAGIAEYERAAAAYEIYAARFAGEKDAADALATATYYRRALGHDLRAIENSAAFVSRYRSRRRKEAAAASFATVDLYSGARREARLRRYLSRHAMQGGPSRIIAADAMLGESLWKRSCTRTSDGLCNRRRDKRVAAAARERFDRALSRARTFERRAIATNTRPDDAARVTHWAGAAHVYVADAAAEASLLDPTLDVEAALAAYDPIADGSPTEWAIVARFRQGAVRERLGQQKRTAKHFSQCLELSWKLRLTNDASRACAAWLERHAPHASAPRSHLRPVAPDPILSRPLASAPRTAR